MCDAPSWCKNLGEHRALKMLELSYYVCVSSGTAEMRAAWFLLAALEVLPAKLLQVGTPARPLFGMTNVKEVDPRNWNILGS